MNYKKRLVLLLLTLMLLSGCTRGKQPTNILLFDQLTLHIGETKRIVENEKLDKLTFYSTNEDVEVSKNGEVIGINIGSAVIIAKDKNGKVGTCVVIVNREKPIFIESLEIMNSLNEAYVGETKTLEYIKFPANADDYHSITWYSSDPEVVSISKDGLLKAVSPGEAKISVKANGTNVSSSFMINVLARENLVALNYYDVTGNVHTSDLVLEAIVKTDYKNVSKGEWISNNPEVAEVNDDGEVTFKSNGKTEINYKITINNEEYIETCLVTVRNLPGYTIIRTPEQLQDIRNISGNYALGNDIDMQEACSYGGILYHGGSGFSPLFSNRDNAFVGIFDGQGYAIKNIYINSSVNNTALFGYLSVVEGKEGIIKNLAIIDGSIIGGNFTSVFAANVGSFTGSKFAGVYNCWTNVTVESGGPASGLVGVNGGTIYHCYTLANVSGNNSLGAIALRQCNNSNVGIEKSFANQEINENIIELVPEIATMDNVSYINASYLTTEAMLQSSTYEGWDTSIWDIQDGLYPILKTPYYQIEDR